MSDKYIIKNCECKVKGKTTLCVRDVPYKKCENITDCVLKQIVEKCKVIKCPCEYKGADCWECTESGARRFADKILKLLDIRRLNR